MPRLNTPPAKASFTRPATLAAWSLGLMSLVACAGDVATPPPARSASPQSAQIDALIGSAACTQQIDCKSIGIGARACGGPQSFRAWSVTQTDAKALALAVSKHRLQQQREIERSGEMSTCQILPDPGARCMQPQPGGAGRCELGGAPGDRSTLR